MLCGCIACLRVFLAHEVVDWIDDGATPVCPACGSATVMPGVIDRAELATMHARRYGAPPAEE
jgi:NAD-dependent SIR2 family protein deacetylase